MPVFVLYGHRLHNTEESDSDLSDAVSEQADYNIASDKEIGS